MTRIGALPRHRWWEEGLWGSKQSIREESRVKKAPFPCVCNGHGVGKRVPVLLTLQERWGRKERGHQNHEWNVHSVARERREEIYHADRPVEEKENKKKADQRQKSEKAKKISPSVETHMIKTFLSRRNSIIISCLQR